MDVRWLCETLSAIHAPITQRDDVIARCSNQMFAALAMRPNTALINFGIYSYRTAGETAFPLAASGLFHDELEFARRLGRVLERPARY